ncbi:MAG: hypothetical protein K6F52_03505 [Clostridia bacterium]|nr:hypothetical protein [Clostridia bacterium]
MKGFAVFLDVDGVLNTRTTVERSPEGYTGIDPLRVKVLADVLSKYQGGDIILVSDWKNMRAEAGDYAYLVSRLGQYGLAISGKTDDNGPDRGAGVTKYLEEHPEIKEYVILDDNKFDYGANKKNWDRLLLTDGIEDVSYASKTPAVEAMLFYDFIRMVG